MSSSCPSALALERHAGFTPDPAVTEHLRECRACQARLDSLHATSALFHRVVFPQTVDTILLRRRTSPRRRLLSWGAALPLAGALAIAVVAVSVSVSVSVPAPPSPTVQAKGSGGLAFHAYVWTEGGARAVRSGDSVDVHAALRFRLHPSVPCHASIISVDERGSISRLFPAEGEGGTYVTGVTELPGGAELDGTLGPERLFALCTRRDVSFETLARLIRGSVARGSVAVRRAERVTGLPEDALQATLLLEKTR